MQLRRDAQVQVDVQGVVMGHERTRRRAALHRIEDGRLAFDVAQVVEVLADAAVDERALLEGLAHFRIDDQVDVALAVAGVHVLEAAPLVGQRADGLAQQDVVLHVQGDLAALRAEDRALAADDVADVQLLEAVIFVGAEIVHLDVDLDAAVLVLQVAEGGLAHAALAHEAAGDPLCRAFQFVEFFLDLRSVAGAFETGLQEGISALRLQRCQLLSADETLLA